MFEALGESLREAREARGLTLEDVAKATRIRVKYLDALETGDFESLPTPVQLRGFLRNYAQYVGLDPSQTLARLDEALHHSHRGILSALFRRRRVVRSDSPSSNGSAAVRPAPPPASWPVARRRLSPWRRLRRLLTMDVVVALLIFGAIMAFFIWGGTRLAATVFAEPRVTATPEILGPTATPTLIANITFTPTSPPPLENFVDVQLSLLIEQRTYLRVSVDGGLDFEGILAPGERLDYVSAQNIEVTTGNGAGVRAILNQTDFGPMGAFGEVVTHIFQPNGFVTPTASITPTPPEALIPTAIPVLNTPSPNQDG